MPRAPCPACPGCVPDAAQPSGEYKSLWREAARSQLRREREEIADRLFLGFHKPAGAAVDARDIALDASVAWPFGRWYSSRRAGDQRALTPTSARVELSNREHVAVEGSVFLAGLRAFEETASELHQLIDLKLGFARWSSGDRSSGVIGGPTRDPGQTPRLIRVDDLSPEQVAASWAGLVQHLTASEPEPDKEQAATERTMLELLQEGIDDLPLRMQIVVIGYFFQGLSTDQLAALVGTGPDEVSALRSQALSRLRSFLRERNAIDRLAVQQTLDLGSPQS